MNKFSCDKVVCITSGSSKYYLTLGFIVPMSPYLAKDGRHLVRFTDGKAYWYNENSFKESIPELDYSFTESGGLLPLNPFLRVAIGKNN